nr:Stp1/IreP family PP2C-type Ser/Thr phosphatase [uncultured Peptostreptococcus sp.]
MDFLFKSHIGMVRKNNEDYCKGEIIEVSDGSELGIFAIADGMGGHNKGEVASQLAVENLIEFFNDNLIHDGIVKIECIEDMIKQAYAVVNTKVYDKSKEDMIYDGMGTTLTMVLVYKNKAYIGNVGDSRCYTLKKDRGLEKITYDHSIVEEYVKANIITEQEARNHPDRNKITRAVGTESVVVVDTYSVDLEEGDKILLATDGLTGAVDRKDIEKTLLDNNIDDLAQGLVDLANDTSGKDNVTVIIVMV